MVDRCLRWSHGHFVAVLVTKSLLIDEGWPFFLLSNESAYLFCGGLPTDGKIKNDDGVMMKVSKLALACLLATSGLSVTQSASAATKDGIDRITSYNVCYTKLLRLPIVHAVSAWLSAIWVAFSMDP